MQKRVARVAAAASLALTGVLTVRIIVIDKPAVVVILLPALAGALLALLYGGSGVLIAAAFLTALTAVVSLIGGIGLLYLPSVVLFLSGAVSSEGRRVTGPTEPKLSPAP